LVRAAGAILGYGTLTLADRLGFSDLAGFPPLLTHAGAMIAGALIAATSWGVLLWLLSGALVAVSMLVAFTPIVKSPALHFVRHDAGGAPVDAIVVLSGSMNEDGRLTGQVLDRVLSALAEARRRQVSTIAMSVLEYGHRRRRLSSESDQRALMALLAPELTVKFVRDVASTRDEAVTFAALANTNGWRRVVVVTSPMHTRRACRTIEVAGLSVECVPAQSRAYSLAHLDGANQRLDVFRDLVYETAATALYSIRGWI
jgi:uncharacterized SAM-binding protein YcdF (DUF218 family)